MQTTGRLQANDRSHSAAAAHLSILMGLALIVFCLPGIGPESRGASFRRPPWLQRSGRRESADIAHSGDGRQLLRYDQPGWCLWLRNGVPDGHVR